MNAYELADKVDLEPYGIYGEQAANMLRQQAQVIATLSDRIAELEKSTMAWYEAGKFVSPQIKELSDEEIIEIGNAVVNLIDSNEGWIEFARAILRKAQEK